MSLLVVLLLSTTVQMGAQCYQTLHQDFRPQGTGSATLINPLPHDDTKPLTIIALGDSVVWGNGDDLPHKFVLNVSQQTADLTRRDVRLFSFAHSGAVLVGTNGALVPSLGGIDQGDPNSSQPNIQWSANCVSQALPDAELVLVDGCINDVGAEDIAIPWPFNWTSVEQVRDRVFANCSNPLDTLLASIHRALPNATIILNSYFLIVSDKSMPLLRTGVTPTEFTPEREQQRLTKVQERLFRGIGQEGALTAARRRGLPSWGERSAEFYNDTMDCFDWAVARANGQDPPALPPDSGDHHCPSVKLTPQKATVDAHTYLAVVPNVAENAYGTTHTHLWKLPIPFLWWTFRKDEMFKKRAAICKALFPGENDRFFCSIDATAHPNVLDSADFRDAILQQLWVAWKP
jgi:hypothetical protein